ncbi:hypothetical protein H5410_047259 [Solanum commersonii]|uniref:Gag-pol polyprotein n=1 Tax=Solanum commersonii TaxID=4109 RepID=A0A9J5XEK5_SOLCO|nr:hypothetical protein H5410_047259 [Solanum commersonii]
MKSPDFTGSSVTKDPENFMKELRKVFEVMHVIDAEQVELVVYQLKGVTRVWFDQWKNGRAEDALIKSMRVREYNLKFTQLSRYAPEMVVDMKSMMSLFVVGLSRLSSKEGKTTMLIGDMDITRLMIHQKQKGPAPSSTRAPAPRNKGEFKNQSSQNFRARLSQSQCSVARGGNETPECAKCGRNHSGVCCDGSTVCFKWGQNGHFMKECPNNRAQSSSVALPDKAAPRGTTSGTGGGVNCLMLSPVAKSKRIRQMLSPKLLEPFSVSTPVGECILAERVYRDCVNSVNHKDTMADLVKLDMTKSTNQNVVFQVSGHHGYQMNPLAQNYGFVTNRLFNHHSKNCRCMTIDHLMKAQIAKCILIIVTGNIRDNETNIDQYNAVNVEISNESLDEDEPSEENDESEFDENIDYIKDVSQNDTSVNLHNHEHGVSQMQNHILPILGHWRMRKPYHVYM